MVNPKKITGTRTLGISKIDYMQNVLIGMKLGPFSRRDITMLTKPGLRAVKMAEARGIVSIDKSGFVRFVGES